MEDWFTVEAVDEETFAISEYRHPEETHCYLLLGSEKALLIDSGLGVSSIQAVVRRITALPVQVATTHVHWDHIGSHRFFDDIAVCETERSWLTNGFPLSLGAVRKNLLQGCSAFPASFDIEQYQIFQGEPRTVLHDGDVLPIGGRELCALATPGHSPGHICFFEPERGYLYTGDLIYAGCLDAFYPTTDPVAFMRSVKKVNALPIRRLLPGHHELRLPLEITGEVDHAFTGLYETGRLRHGAGRFAFSNFQIHL